MGVLHVDPQLLEREDGLASHIGAGVQGGEVEVAALVEDLRYAAVLRPRTAEVEVLELGPDVEGIEAELAGPVECPAQHMTRVALVGLAAGRDDVAEHPG